MAVPGREINRAAASWEVARGGQRRSLSHDAVPQERKSMGFCKPSPLPTANARCKLCFMLMMCQPWFSAAQRRPFITSP
jgi:hypothetical protein